MLRGERVALRAVTAADVPVMQAEVHDDVELWMIASGGPWLPRSAERATAEFRQREEKDDPDKVRFAVEELATGDLAGLAQMWGINMHDRRAHLGFTLRPAWRGRGLGTDTIRVLCDYAFRVRGLNRLQVDTLASNAAARKAAEAAGFVLEGQLRGTAWVDGEFTDEAVFGLLAHEWAATRRGRPA